MPSVGEKLRSARLDQGLDPSQVATHTKISQRYIEAIENDDRQSLPGAFFYKNFVHQYAAYLGLEVAELQAEVERIVKDDGEPALPGQRTAAQAKQFRPPPLDFGGRPAGGRRMSYSLALLVAVVLGCSGFYAWWHNAQVLASAESVPSSPTPQPADAKPAPQESKSVGPVAAATPDPDQFQIDIAAIEQTWLSIAPDGKQVFSGVLQPAEVRTVAARETARIRVGNAGGLEVRLNGKSLGKIGLEGQVRTLIIDRSGLHVVEPKPLAVPSPSAETPVSNDRAPVAPALNQQ